MYRSVDEIILQHSVRGMDKLYQKNPKKYCKEAVENFIKLPKGNLFLYTGFYVNGYAETDGPIGTYFLAKALDALGYHPIIITDNYCKNYFKEFETIYMPLSGYSEIENSALLQKHQPICHISIERCGKNSKGKYENAWGVDIGNFTAPLDELFQLASKSSPTFAIGDGGNEIGMGNFKGFLREFSILEPCQIECDFPIIASVSNWGAYGFIAYLEKFFQKTTLPTLEQINDYLAYILSLGSVDGIKGIQSHSVDGHQWEIEKEILNELKSATM